MLEFKRTTGERREAMHALTAMLNHRGGKIVFGVEPDRRVLGQQVGDRPLEEVAQEVHRIDPPTFPSLDRVPLGDGFEALIVSVGAGPNRPYTYNGQAYRRVGTTSVAMSRDEFNRMLLERLHGDQG